MITCIHGQTIQFIDLIPQSASIVRIVHILHAHNDYAASSHRMKTAKDSTQYGPLRGTILDAKRFDLPWTHVATTHSEAPAVWMGLRSVFSPILYSQNSIGTCEWWADYIIRVGWCSGLDGDRNNTRCHDAVAVSLWGGLGSCIEAHCKDALSQVLNYPPVARFLGRGISIVTFLASVQGCYGISDNASHIRRIPANRQPHE